MIPIVIDDREYTQHPEIDNLIQLPYKVERLGEGDYAFLDRADNGVGIERAEINNLLQKLRTGELEEQLSRCGQGYSTVILLVEGVWDSIGGYLAVYKSTSNGYYRIRTYPHTRYESVIALLTRLQELGLEVIYTPNFDCSMEAIKSVYLQRRKVEEAHSLFKRVRAPHIPVKSTNNPAVPKLLGLVDRLSEKTAIRLIHKYNSIWNILQADEKELLQVEGMGKGLIKNLKEGVGK